MGWTKRQLIEQAFDEIGFAKYVYDIQPEQLNASLIKLDAMMGEWNGEGIRLGYPIPSSPDNDSLSDDSEIPDSANRAVYTNLAITIAPSLGKIPSKKTENAAQKGYQTLLSRATMPNEMQLPGTMPAGAGNKSWRYRKDPFLNTPEESLAAGSDNIINFD